MHMVRLMRFPRRHTYLVGGVFSVLVAPVALWWGYCWGWWLQTSNLTQRLFQCQCPIASEATRYAPLEVLAPACRNPRFLSVSADDRTMLYNEYLPGGQLILVDLTTGQQRPLPFAADQVAGAVVIDSQYVLIRSPDIEPIYTLYDTSNSQSSQIIPQLFRLEDKLLSKEVLHQIGKATRVYIGVEELFIFTPTTENNLQSVVFYGDAQTFRFSIDIIRAKLTSLAIFYTYNPIFDAPRSSGATIPWPDGRLQVTQQGIQSQSGAMLRSVPAYFLDLSPRFEPRYWVADGRGVIYYRATTTVGDLGQAVQVISPWFEVPQPILLLPVAE